MYYFGYGSNFKKEQIETRVPKADFIGLAKMHDKQVVFRGNKEYGYRADLIDKFGVDATVCVYSITEEVLAVLDICEKVKDNVSSRCFGQAILDNGKVIEGVYYKKNPNFELGIPQDDYIGKMCYGYIERGVDIEELKSIILYNKFEILRNNMR